MIECKTVRICLAIRNSNDAMYTEMERLSSRVEC